jgi:hypothetical protein
MEQTNEADSVLQEALIESYGKADTWQLKRQILSILAKTMHYKSIIEKIPGLTEYRYYKAKNRSAVYGCALPPPCNEQLRQRMDPHKLDIFLDFITSSHIIKDLPFGERKLRLSNGKVVETPKVIRCLAPAAIIQQFKQYCVENDEVPLGIWCISFISLVHLISIILINILKTRPYSLSMSHICICSLLEFSINQIQKEICRIKIGNKDTLCMYVIIENQ